MSEIRDGTKTIRRCLVRRTHSSQSRASKDRFRARFAIVTGRGIGIRRVMMRAVTNDNNSWRTVATRKIFDYKPRRPLRTTADIELETSGGPRRPPRRVSPTAVIRRKPFSCRPAAQAIRPSTVCAPPRPPGPTDRLPAVATADRSGEKTANYIP